MSPPPVSSAAWPGAPWPVIGVRALPGVVGAEFARPTLEEVFLAIVGDRGIDADAGTDGPFDTTSEERR